MKREDLSGVDTMARRPPRACRKPGCPGLTWDRSGYCEEHMDLERQRRRTADANRPGPRERGYDTLWDRFRDWFLRQPGNQVCALCKKNMSRVVHHIVPVEERPDLRLDPKNCQALCRECHERLHGRRA
jgi:5-methylcytosine-specific restriction protein A